MAEKIGGLPMRTLEESVQLLIEHGNLDPNVLARRIIRGSLDVAEKEALAHEIIRDVSDKEALARELLAAGTVMTCEAAGLWASWTNWPDGGGGPETG